MLVYLTTAVPSHVAATETTDFSIQSSQEERKLSASFVYSRRRWMDTFLLLAVGSPAVKVLLKEAKIAAEVGWVAELLIRHD